MASTMKCARFAKPGTELEICDVPIPTTGKGQVRIQVIACGVCHSDLFIGSGHFPPVSFPRIPGHEVAGIIDEVGEGVTNFKKGDSVGVGWFGGHCGTCAACLANEWVCCEKGQVCGAHYDGGWAEYMVAPADAVARIPEGLDYKTAGPLMCAGITCFNSIRHQGLLAGDIVAVQGIGGLGHLAIQYCNKMGYKVVALSNGKEKEKLARELGAHVYIDGSATDAAQELTKLGGAKVIVCTAPNAKVISPLVNGLSVGGKLLLVAGLGEPLTVDPGALLFKKRSVVGWPSGDSRDSEDALRFSVLTGVSPMIETFSLQQANEAVKKILDNTIRFRGVLVIKQ